jgi:integrase
MITLPNGCKCSKLVVYPKNWQSKNAKISSNWYIKYRFYDPRHHIPKQVMVKRMNQYKTLLERQEATKNCLKEELEKLTKGTNNPFERVQKAYKNTAILTGDSAIIDALNYALQKVSVSEITHRDLRYLIAQIEKALKRLNLQSYPISKTSRKIVRQILEEISSTPDRFNKNRSYLMILFSELCEAEALDNNPVRDIKKKKVVKHLRTVLTDEERIKVNQHLQENYPAFHRFLHIFFHSGARISELLRVREYDLDLSNQRYKVVVQKGRHYKEAWKTIKDIALPYWQTVAEGCGNDDYVFSNGLIPGSTSIKPYQITKRWYRLVKKPLGIKADIYSLKHLHTTEVVDLLKAKILKLLFRESICFSIRGLRMPTSLACSR